MPGEKGPSSPESKEEQLVNKIADEAMYWRHQAPQKQRLGERQSVWQAINNVKIDDRAPRIELFKKVFKECKIREWKKKKQREELEFIEREEVLKQAAEVEKNAPPDAYGADLLEDEE
ncbi:MAG: hypothetical protein ABH846_00120 [Patescibacteria group bacterium]